MALSRDHRERRERSFSNSECRKRFRGSRARGVRPNGCSRAQIKLQIKGRGGGGAGVAATAHNPAPYEADSPVACGMSCGQEGQARRDRLEGTGLPAAVSLGMQRWRAHGRLCTISQGPETEPILSRGSRSGLG